ncbi:MAG: hypothetical protein RIQ93_376 [Verrucomicrobiota bacterium]|jgi:tetratricopeptide (TPR) repeat protein
MLAGTEGTGSHARSMTRRPGFPSPLLAATGLLGAIGLALITLASPGATRMYAWPWSLAYAVALAAPVLGLLLRAFDRLEPLRLPDRGWSNLAVAAILLITASALASPHRAATLLFSAPLLAGIALFLLSFDWLHAVSAETPRRMQQLWRAAAGFAVAIELVSVGLWLAGYFEGNAGFLLAARNPHPLGHSNYTAGLALLMLPGFGAAAFHARGSARAGALVAAVLSGLLLFTSGSRGGVIALGALGVSALFAWRIPARQKALVALACGGAALVFVFANPRTRAMLASADAGAPPNISNVQRSAMALAGWRQGLDRPLLGWGAGSTPLVYPRYRAGLDGGAENVLQLHSLPVQLWADFGGAGVLAAAVFGLLAWRDRRRHAIAGLTLAGYAVSSLFDWQLDVPVFAAAIALLAACLAAPPTTPPPTRASTLTGGLALGVFILVAVLGRIDPAPEMNARALELARDPAKANEAIALLQDSLALNPHQEIAHFNLGWLLLVRDPPAAERHFREAARLVPDKGGVYFGLGLARLNRGQPGPAADAFALECLNDPVFLTSPWWSEPNVARLRPATEARLAEFQQRVRDALPATGWPAGEARYLQALTAWLARRADRQAVAATANTAERRALFGGAAQLPEFTAGPGRSFRRTRPGYPVLARNLEVAPPMDLFDVQMNAALTEQTLFIFPAKGWLPSPLLLALLDARDSPKN